MKPDISKRSNEKELIDFAGIAEKEHIRNFKELDYFNKITGANRTTLKKLTPYFSLPKEYHLTDLGAGGGQFLVDAYNFAIKSGIKLKITGVDNNPLAVKYIQNRIRHTESIMVVCEDYKDYLSNPSVKTDIIHCSLFCHHLTDEEIIELITLAGQKNAVLVINDLRRNIWAYYGAKTLTTVFNGTRLAKNDGPLSVLKGFTQKEITGLARRAKACCPLFYNLPLWRFLLIIKPPAHAHTD